MSPRVRRSGVSIPMTLWLLVLWLAVFGSVNILNVVGGVLVALAVQLLFPLPTSTHLWHWRVFPLLYLIVRFAWDLIVAGFQVAWIVVSGKTHDDGIVRCDLRSDDPVYMTIVAAMTSMVPGTIVVEASRESHALYLHVLDLKAHGGVEGVRRAVRAQEARVLVAFAPGAVLYDCGMLPPEPRQVRGKTLPHVDPQVLDEAAKRLAGNGKHVAPRGGANATALPDGSRVASAAPDVGEGAVDGLAPSESKSEDLS